MAWTIVLPLLLLGGCITAFPKRRSDVGVTILISTGLDHNTTLQAKLKHEGHTYSKTFNADKKSKNDDESKSKEESKIDDKSKSTEEGKSEDDSKSNEKSKSDEESKTEEQISSEQGLILGRDTLSPPIESSSLSKDSSKGTFREHRTLIMCIVVGVIILIALLLVSSFYTKFYKRLSKNLVYF